MSETIAVYIRVAVTVLMFASLLVTVLNMTVIASSAFYSLRSNVTDGLSNSIYSERSEIVNQDKVTVPEAYKYCEVHEDINVGMPKDPKDPTGTDDLDEKDFIAKYAHKYVKFVSCIHSGDHSYDLQFVD